MIKNLSQLKKTLDVGMQYKILENAFKPYNNGLVREISKVQSNGVNAWDNRDHKSGTFLFWQKAKNMRFNEDGTIDFLLGEEMNDLWLIDQQAKENKDYWLKIKVIY